MVSEPKRILIATVTAGAGHLQAAAAIEEAWRACHPDDVVEKLDLLDLVSPLQRRLYLQTYMKLVEHAPEIWGLMFRKTDDTALALRLRRVRRALAEHSNRKFVRRLREFAPDVVVCTHYLPVEVMGHVIEKGRGPKPFIVCVVTDFEAHTFWLDDTVDLYCVATADTKASIVARGAPAERVVATGIPIAAKFSTQPDSRAVRETLGLSAELPVLLVLSGGFGLGPVKEILDGLDRVQAAFQTIVVTGRNEELRRELAARDARHPTLVLGFATNMHELMAAADLLVSKPGGLTTAEALAMGRPLFILNPIPGQETANSDFLLERGAAHKANRVGDLPFRIEELLGSAQLAAMARAAKALGQPGAAAAVCREIRARLESAATMPAAGLSPPPR